MHYRAFIEHTAAAYRLDPLLLAALVQQESSGNPWAWNPEPRYRWLWDVRLQKPFRTLTADEQSSETPPKDFPFLAGDRDQEWWAQQASWGLGQVMGGVARELGFLGHYISELCDPATGLKYSAMLLSDLLKWSKGDVDAALGAYNAGRGAASSPAALEYISKVHGHYAALKTERHA